MSDAALSSRRSRPLAGTAAIAGDKSCSHRALVLGAMASGTTRITNLSDAGDVLSTRRAIEAFNVEVEAKGSEIIVHGGSWHAPAGPIDCGNSGTTARLLMGAVAGMAVEATFTGDASLSRRPMRRVTAPLLRMGATISDGDRLPTTIQGGSLGGIHFTNEPASAQVKSAILLAGLGTRAPVRISDPVASRDHSEIMLGEFGCEVIRGEGSVALGEHRALTGCALAIAGDPSSAAFPLTAAAIVPGSRVSVQAMLVNPLRTGLFEALEEMGADVELANERVQSGEIVADVTVGFGTLQSVRIAAGRIPSLIDEVPLLAVACAFADGESVIEGLGELRHKESDRLGAIVAGLTACGVSALVRGDDLHIFGRKSVRGGASIATQGDHRIAMAFLTLGLASDEPVPIDRPEMIATSFPGFVATMRSLGADIS